MKEQLQTATLGRSRPSERVHLVRAAQVSPFWATVKKTGAQVRLLGRESGLPVEAVESGTGVLGEYAVWRFLEFSADRIGQPHLGYLCDKTHPITSDMLRRCSPDVRTLQDLLFEIFEEVVGESSGSNYLLERTQAGAWLRRLPVFVGDRGSWQMEQFFLASFIRLIRTCCGPGWLPPTITVSSLSKPAALPDEWNAIKVEWGIPLTSIFVPARDLESPPLAKPDPIRRSPPRVRRPTFRELVDRQVRWGYVGIEKAAEETGLTVITLQRWLKQNQTSYSELVDDARSKRARFLLAHSDQPIGEISAGLGYSFQSNFTRAFERIVGVSPSEFRQRSRET